MRYKRVDLRTLLPLLLMIFSHTHAQAQKVPARIEINPYVQFDRYPAFSYAINSVRNNEVSIRGASWGISGAYKFPVSRNIYLKAGLGYYRYSFNKIKRTNSSFGESNVRSINYPGMADLLYYTDKYWYNSLLVTVGAERAFPLSESMQLTAGVNLNNYYTFSQRYHIDYYNANNPIENNYKTSNSRYFGFSAELRAGLEKKIGEFSLGPQIILPIFGSWKQDRIFPGEEDSHNRTKWLRGVGAGITFSYSL